MSFDRENKPLGPKQVKERDSDTHPLLRDQVILLIGGVGSGKSNAGLHLADEWQKTRQSKYEKMVWFTGSPADPKMKLLDPKKVQIYDPSTKQRFIDEVSDLVQTAKEHPDEKLIKPSLVVIDDGLGTEVLPLRIADDPISELFRGHRHSKATVMVMSQKWKGVNTFLRENAGIVYYWPSNDQEMKAVAAETKFNPADLKRARSIIGSGDAHNFIGLHNIERKITKNFNEVIME